MTQKLKKSWIILAGTVLVLGVGLFALRNISFEAMGEAMRAFSVQSVGLALLLMVLQLFAMILRFYILLPSPRVGFSKVIEAMSYGQLVNSLLPARAGDVIKAVVIGKSGNGNVSVMTSAGVLVADKLVDILALISALFIVGVHNLPESKMLWTWPEWVYWVFAAVALAGLIALRFFLSKIREKWNALAAHFVSGLAAIGDVKRFAGALVAGQMVWLAEAAALKVLCGSQGIELNWPQAFFVLALLNLAMSFVFSVANVGPFEASIVYALAAFSVSTETALAIATVHHANLLASVALWSGGIFIWNKIKRPPLRAALRGVGN